MNRLFTFSLPVLLFSATLVEAQPGGGLSTAIVTATNAATNQLLVYDAAGNLVQTVATQGQGGVGGNSGGIAAQAEMLAVVNYGSKSVSIFAHQGNGFQVRQIIATASNPVSVAFGNDHLYVLTNTKVESHQMLGSGIASNPDGVVTLLKADASAAQVGVLPTQLIITEKSNVLETVNLQGNGAVSGAATLVQNIPANVDTPFGLVTRGDDAYVTIAHADEISLVRNGSVLTVTPSGTQHSPCWLALSGPFLYSSNSPSHSVSRYTVYGQKIVQDAAVAATFTGSPTDIAAAAGLVAVIDGSGSTSRLSIFSIDQDGNLISKGVATMNVAANGVAIVTGSDR